MVIKKRLQAWFELTLYDGRLVELDAYRVSGIYAAPADKKKKRKYTLVHCDGQTYEVRQTFQQVRKKRDAVLRKE